MKLVPFDLIGKEKVDDIVNIGNRGKKRGKKTSFEIKIVSATTGGGSGFFPFGDVAKAMIEKNLGILTHDNSFGTVDIFRKTEKGIDESGGIEVGGIGGKWM